MNIDLDTYENSYRYFAFISYKRADSEWADWLCKNLQSYRLPASICKKHQELPKRLCPVFLDKEELLPGNLSENLRANIAQSKFFIVICSKNSQIHPEYIDLELQYFLETHNGDYGRVIPFIVDDSPQPEKDCFSPRMQALCAEHEVIGVNVTEKGKRRALLKVIASMHGLQVSEIESADDIRKKKQRILAAGISLLTIALCTGGALYWWNHKAVHTDYYLGYVWENNVPKGVNPISEPENYNYYYEFKTVDSLVQSVEHLNYAGTLCPQPDETTVLNQGASRMEFTYSGKKEKYLDIAKYYDYKGLPIICYEYSEDGTHVTLLQDETSGISGYADVNFDESTSFAKKESISRFVSEYDKNGRMTRRYYAYGEDFASVADENGIRGYDLQYDDAGNLISVSYFSSADGEANGAVDGIHTIEYGFELDSVNIQWVRYLDMNGNPVNCADGWSQKKYIRNYNNAISEIVYLNVDGERVLCTEGYASVKYGYDGNVLTEKRYYDGNNEPVMNQNGYAVEILGVNEAGEILSARYLDAQGNPVADKELKVYGFDTVKTSDREWHRIYVDQDGNPMMTAEGYAYIYHTVNEYSLPLRQEYRDANNELCTEHYASCTYVYDEVYHRVTEWRFYDEEGNPVMNQEVGVAAVLTEYDSRGNMTMEQYLDEKGNLTSGNRGYAKFTSSTEREGNYIVEVTMFYGEDDKPVFYPKLGSMGYEATTDEMGNLVGFVYLDENEHPYINEDEGYAGITYIYDENGYINLKNYIGKVGQSMMVNGYATVITNHDAHGNVLDTSYYDTSGELVVVEEEGYARSICVYDENDRLITIEYYGEKDGKAVLKVNPKKGFAALDVSYGENGELMEMAYYGAKNGEAVPIVNEEDGFHSFYKTIDEDNSVWTYYFGVEDGTAVRAVNQKEGCAIKKVDYDENSNFTGIHYFDENGERMNNPLKGYAVALFEVDEQGELVSAAYGKMENGELVSYQP